MDKHLKCQPYKMVKHTQKIRWQNPTNCLNVFVHFVGLALKGLMLQNFVSEIFEGKELQKEPLLISRIKVVYVKAINLKSSDF